jgi:hypothetical protein
MPRRNRNAGRSKPDTGALADELGHLARELTTRIHVKPPSIPALRR